MSNSNLNNSKSPFDSIRHLDEKGHEFWYARELMPMLSYKQWQKFKAVIDNAIENIETLTSSTVEHFLPVEVKNIDSEGKRLQGRTGLNYKLSRLACYHIALSCDSRGNDSVKMAKHYFAVKTREAELQENKPQLPQTYKEALKALIKEIEAKELLEIEKQLLEKENLVLAEAVDELFEYSSIIRVAKYNDVSETSFNWRLLKAASLKLNLEIKKVPSPRFEYQNLYSHQAWRLAYPEYRLPETTTLVIAAPI